MNINVKNNSKSILMQFQQIVLILSMRKKTRV